MTGQLQALGRFLLLIWEGFYIIGDGLGFDDRRAGHFADIAWIGLASVLGLWLASLVLLSAGVLT